ncbi:MAG: septum formation initiator family protein [Ruminococcus sp.]|nr:septum formation initiator family protein [Ruminococcus sp.]
MAYSAYAAQSRGYDLSLFETSGTAARKPSVKKTKKKTYAHKNNIVELPEMNVDKTLRRKHNPASLIAGFVMVGVIAVIVGIIIHGQVQLAEINQQIATAQQVLTEKESEHNQMQARVEGFLSTAAVEECARTELGMAKATNQQKEYISLETGDKAEVYIQENSNIFTKIGDFLGSLWS